MFSNDEKLGAFNYRGSVGAIFDFFFFHASHLYKGPRLKRRVTSWLVARMASRESALPSIVIRAVHLPTDSFSLALAFVG